MITVSQRISLVDLQREEVLVEDFIEAVRLPIFTAVQSNSNKLSAPRITRKRNQRQILSPLHNYHRKTLVEKGHEILKLHNEIQKEVIKSTSPRELLRVKAEHTGIQTVSYSKLPPISSANSSRSSSLLTLKNGHTPSINSTQRKPSVTWAATEHTCSSEQTSRSSSPAGFLQTKSHRQQRSTYSTPTPPKVKKKEPEAAIPKICSDQIANHFSKNHMQESIPGTVKLSVYHHQNSYKSKQGTVALNSGFHTKKELAILQVSPSHAAEVLNMLYDKKSGCFYPPDAGSSKRMGFKGSVKTLVLGKYVSKKTFPE